MRIDSRAWLVSLSEKVRLCLALLVAAGFSDVLSGDAWHRIAAAVKLWLGLLKDGGMKVEGYIYERRLKTCAACPLYYKPLRTCGSPLRKDSQELGCWCNMEQKAKYERSNCWLDTEIERGHPSGWVAAQCGGLPASVDEAQ